MRSRSRRRYRPTREALAMRRAVPAATSADEIAERIERAERARANRDLYQCALEYHGLRYSNAWRLLTNSDGDPRYVSWHLFAKAKLPISYTYSYMLLAVVEIFSRQQVEQYGFRKLATLITVDPRRRKKLLKRAPYSTVAELELEARKSNKLLLSDQVARRFAMALRTTRFVVPLFARGEDRRAVRLLDLPVGETVVDGQATFRVKLWQHPITEELEATIEIESAIRGDPRESAHWWARRRRGHEMTEARLQKRNNEGGDGSSEV